MSAVFRWTWPMSTPGSMGRGAAARGITLRRGVGHAEGDVVDASAALHRSGDLGGDGEDHLAAGTTRPHLEGVLLAATRQLALAGEAKTHRIDQQVGGRLRAVAGERDAVQ